MMKTKRISIRIEQSYFARLLADARARDESYSLVLRDILARHYSLIPQAQLPSIPKRDTTRIKTGRL